MADNKVLVVGASGRVGQRAVKALRRHGFPVRAMVRDASGHGLIEDEGVEVVVGDVTSESDQRRALQGVTYVVSALAAKARPTAPTSS